MIKLLLANLFSLFLLNMNGSSGFIDDDTIALFVIGIILLHVFSITAYISRLFWLRILCGILYLPVFAIPLVLTMLNAGFILLFIPPLLFFYYVIIKERKETGPQNDQAL